LYLKKNWKKKVRADLKFLKKKGARKAPTDDWDFTQENKAHMEHQIRQLGASCDWDKKTFTLDEKIVDVVYETF
jgi:valyl-tRNA synthetase